ncbi:hypothetical protein QCA50_006569 [Cerrena zonata]|uniref:Uncharacterized protein n=1 Tax=Cerrena zonata TaxID=2478898 RepID=A0AAW0GFI3_9APHY
MQARWSTTTELHMQLILQYIIPQYCSGDVDSSQHSHDGSDDTREDDDTTPDSYQLGRIGRLSTSSSDSTPEPSEDNNPSNANDDAYSLRTPSSIDSRDPSHNTDTIDVIALSENLVAASNFFSVFGLVGAQMGGLFHLATAPATRHAR